jgi:ABC-type lipoprotein export system ATPase subunit
VELSADPGAAPLITCEGLVKIYKAADLEVTALQGLELEVRRGEMLAIMGASGSGKTTLLNILSGLDAPSAGRCVVAGVDLTRLTEGQRDAYCGRVIGQVWQQTARNLFFDATLAENVELPQALSGVLTRARRARALDLLERVGLGGLAKRRPGEVSGGEQQRCSIAVALANGPALLLADEPTGNLDSQTAYGVFEVLRAFNREELTVVTVTHDPAIAALCDRTIAIRDGRTSTETVRVAASLAEGAGVAASALGSLTGLSSSTHREAAVIDRAGRVQLPHESVERLGFRGRAEVRETSDHLELWPLGSAPSDAQPGPTGE